MADDPISAKAKLDVAIQGFGSQAYVVSMAVIAGICACISLIFAWYYHPLTVVPLSLTAVFSGLATWKHGKSQRVLDLLGAKPTRVSNGERAIEVDPATLTDANAVEAVERIMANMFHRERLPPPDGLVDSQFKPDQSPHAVNSAIHAVESINSQCDEAHRCAKELFQRSTVVDEITASQPPVAKPGNIPPLSDRLMVDVEDANEKKT